MFRKALVVCSVTVLWAGISAGQDATVGPRLQEACVTIVKASQDRGSGTIVARTVDGKPVKWVLTAAHVVDDLREVRAIVAPDGSEKKEVRYRDAQILQELREDGRMVGEIKMDAKVINVDEKFDLALLRVRMSNYKSGHAEFYLDTSIPPPGTRIYHCASPGGSANAASLTSGIIAQVGRRIEAFGGSEGIYDQTTAPALPGSSGGMIALESDGRIIGVVTLGLRGSDSFHYMVPVRRIRDWAQKTNIVWLVDPKAKEPTQADIDKIPVENTSPGLSRPAVAPTPAPKAKSGPERLLLEPQMEPWREIRPARFPDEFKAMRLVGSR